MSDAQTPQSGDEPEDVFEQLMATRPEPTPEVAEALAELETAREVVANSLEDLTGATQSALDVPAKIRRNPVKTAALLGGTGFLAVGGPRRVARFMARRVLPQPRPDKYAGILPSEIEKVLKDSGVAKDPEVRRALDKDFADYLKQKGKYGLEPNGAATFWRTFDRVAGPMGTAGARVMVQRLMEAEQTRAIKRTESRGRAITRAAAEKEA
jgi:hypothetical protein